MKSQVRFFSMFIKHSSVSYFPSIFILFFIDTLIPSFSFLKFLIISLYIQLFSFFHNIISLFPISTHFSVLFPNYNLSFHSSSFYFLIIQFVTSLLLYTLHLSANTNFRLGTMSCSASCNYLNPFLFRSLDFNYIHFDLQTV